MLTVLLLLPFVSKTTFDPSAVDVIESQLSSFGHRDQYGPGNYDSRCPVGEQPQTKVLAVMPWDADTKLSFLLFYLGSGSSQSLTTQQAWSCVVCGPASRQPGKSVSALWPLCKQQLK